MSMHGNLLFKKVSRASLINNTIRDEKEDRKTNM